MHVDNCAFPAHITETLHISEGGLMIITGPAMTLSSSVYCTTMLKLLAPNSSKVNIMSKGPLGENVRWFSSKYRWDTKACLLSFPCSLVVVADRPVIYIQPQETAVYIRLADATIRRWSVSDGWMERIWWMSDCDLRKIIQWSNTDVPLSSLSHLSFRLYPCLLSPVRIVMWRDVKLQSW